MGCGRGAAARRGDDVVDSVAAVSLTEASRVETGTRSLLQYWLSHVAAGCQLLR